MICKQLLTEVETTSPIRSLIVGRLVATSQKIQQRLTLNQDHCLTDTIYVLKKMREGCGNFVKIYSPMRFYGIRLESRILINTTANKADFPRFLRKTFWISNITDAVVVIGC